MFIISAITSEYMPIWHKDNIESIRSFSITPLQEILKASLALSKAWSIAYKIPSK